MECALQIKHQRLGKVQDLLAKALQPPDPLAVTNAVELLTAIGALDSGEQLTPLGLHLAKIPCDPRVAKMLLMGAIFKCLSPALTMAAGMAYRDPFVMPLEKREEADAMKAQFAGKSGR